MTNVTRAGTDPSSVLAGSRVAAAVSSVRAEELVQSLRALLAVPSVTGSAAESEAQHRLEPLLRASGLETDLWRIDLDETLADPDFPGLEAPRSEAWGLVGESADGTAGGDGPVVVLNGHVDVVPPGGPDDWSVDPWAGVVRGGRVFGRGATDMKAGLVCQLAAITALRDAGVRLGGRVALHSVVGEEDGGLGTFATLRRGHRGDVAIIAEPTALGVVPANGGALTFRLTVAGRAAHASVRTTGVDAMDHYVAVHAALRRLEEVRNRRGHPLMDRWALPWPLSVGTVHAGDWASTVPDRVVAEGRLGVAIGEQVAHARAELEAAVAELGSDDPWLAAHPVRVEWVGGQFAPGITAADGPLVGLVRAAHGALTGDTPDVHGVPYGSDLRLMVGAGVPTVQYGPGELAQAHAPDESVPVDQMVAVTRTLVLAVATACGAR